MIELDLDANRAPSPPRDAATVLLVRDRAGSPEPALEVFCVVRHVKSAFLGGAAVFPGGKVDESDRDPGWATRAVGAVHFVAGEDVAHARAFAVAACREALEEAAILPTASGLLQHEDAVALRSQLAAGGVTFQEALIARGLSLDLSALRPFGRWVTPVAESRRFDTRFFLAAAPKGQHGVHDAHETTASFWGTPQELLRRFDQAEIQLAPPTHRCLELLATTHTTADALALAARLELEPICPQLVPVNAEGAEATMALVLPGDPDHEVQVPRVPGLSRFVLREGRWVPEGAPPEPAV